VGVVSGVEVLAFGVLWLASMVVVLVFADVLSRSVSWEPTTGRLIPPTTVSLRVWRMWPVQAS
jgi:hypothetical protein